MYSVKIICKNVSKDYFSYHISNPKGVLNKVNNSLNCILIFKLRLIKCTSKYPNSYEAKKISKHDSNIEIFVRFYEKM